MTALNVFACVACANAEFPRRLLCPACGAAEFVEVDASRGCVEETTTLHHRPGRAGGEAAYLGTVLTGAGPRVIARLAQALVAGTVVTLRVDSDGAILGSVS
jgi:uncharacterized protein